jgi:hypothetical protein
MKRLSRNLLIISLIFTFITGSQSNFVKIRILKQKKVPKFVNSTESQKSTEVLPSNEEISVPKEEVSSSSPNNFIETSKEPKMFTTIPKDEQIPSSTSSEPPDSEITINSSAVLITTQSSNSLSRQAIVINGTCISEGVTAHETDCHSYHVCLKVTSDEFENYIFDCPYSKAWNQKLLLCDFQENVAGCESRNQITKLEMVTTTEKSQDYNELAAVEVNYDKQENLTNFLNLTPLNYKLLTIAIFIISLLLFCLYCLIYSCIMMCHERSSHTFLPKYDVQLTRMPLETSERF